MNDLENKKRVLLNLKIDDLFLQVNNLQNQHKKYYTSVIVYGIAFGFIVFIYYCISLIPHFGSFISTIFTVVLFPLVLSGVGNIMFEIINYKKVLNGLKKDMFQICFDNIELVDDVQFIKLKQLFIKDYTN